MQSEPEHHPHEEAIVPVKPVLRSRAAPEAAPPRRPRVTAPVVAGAAAVLLTIAAAAVFLLLPGIVEQRAADREQAAPVPIADTEPAAPAEPALTEEQIAALTDEADRLLAQLLTQQQRLGDLAAESWGGTDWQRYQDVARAGDDAYLAASYRDAIDNYTQALELGETLLGRSSEITARALEAGQRALEAGQAALAIEQFDLVLSVEQENAEALAGRARAERLPEVLRLVREAGELAQANELAQAAERYRQALAIDAAWSPAARALKAVEADIENRRFETLMSEGYRALTEEQYEDADERFRAALAMRPGTAEASDGILQAQQGMHLDQIALAEARALAFERREMWPQAIEQYEAALATDDSLTFAKEGLERSRARADLDVKLANLIDNPNLLFGDQVLASAEALLEQAHSTSAWAEAAGESAARLDAQIERLADLITLATTPVRVELRSDELTEVTVYRVGELGVFSARELDLRPGNYTAIGSRDGYRDVRKTFTVRPGAEPEPIDIVCVEPI